MINLQTGRNMRGSLRLVRVVYARAAVSVGLGALRA